jgi:D-amino-acid dehydrogenase
MKVIVIGSGLIGITTAYFLRLGGHEVTVIEREQGVGRQTSFANGALLTPSMPEPWNTPGCWRVLLASLARSDAPLQLRFRALPSLTGWGIRFLANSAPKKFRRNTIANLRLALHSLAVMHSLRQQTGIEYGHAARGTLRVFRDVPALDRAEVAAERLVPEGLLFKRLTCDETVALEPALEPIAPELSGALYYEADELGDAYRFCVAMADQAMRQGVEFRFGTEVTALETQRGRISAVMSSRERFVAELYVVAAGSYSTPLLRQVGVRLPVRPAKGYSVTFQRDDRPSLSIPVVDDQLHAAVVPLGRAIRVAGTAEFAGYDRRLDSARIQNLMRLLQRVLPRERLDPATAQAWCGLRPMCADGVPIIGHTPIANLLINTGHGHLGWTLAAGSAHVLADLVAAQPAAVDAAQFSLARFSA